MKEYVIATSSTSDLPLKYVQERNITLLPFTFIINDDEYKDDFGKSMSTEKFYEIVREGALPSTSMINYDTYYDFFSSALNAGKDVLCIEFSSALSGSYQNAKAVAEKLNKTSENKVYVVDSLCASMGLGLLMDYLLDMRDAGKSVEELYAWAQEHKKNIIHWFTVDDLNHLFRGGRVSRVSAFLGSMLSIKPVLEVNGKGQLIPKSKTRGRKKAIKQLLENMKDDIIEHENQKVFISHAACLKDAEYLAELIQQSFPKIKKILVHYVGPVVGAHAGPGTLALFYYGQPRV